jgi:hypothetical protein
MRAREGIGGFARNGGHGQRRFSRPILIADLVQFMACHGLDDLRPQLIIVPFP